MEEYIRNMLVGIGEDPTREGLVNTPKRCIQSFKYLTQGYHQSLETIINDAIFSSDNNEMVIVKNIDLYSLCEHHLLPFYGKCHVAYMPQGKVLGLSKIARVVDMYAKRLQIQENLTRQIAQAIYFATQASGVAVMIEAKHLCMMMRGVEKQHSLMTTFSTSGEFKNNLQLRNEFLNSVKVN